MDSSQISIQIDEKVNTYGFLSDRAVFPIELPYDDLNKINNSSFEAYIKKKMQNKNLKPFKNQEGLVIDKSKIKTIKWMEFLKKNMSTYMIDHMGLYNGKDSYQICVAVYY